MPVTCGSGCVFAWVCRERVGSVAAGRPLVQMSPGRVAASSFILPRTLPAATGLGLRQTSKQASGRAAFMAAVGGSGAGVPCPWRRTKGGGRNAAGGHSPERAWDPSARPTDPRAWKRSKARFCLVRRWAKNQKKRAGRGPARCRRSGDAYRPALGAVGQRRRLQCVASTVAVAASVAVALVPAAAPALP